MSSEKILGQVKWFNNKSGFGFITCKDGKLQTQDVFVHHSDLKVTEEQYRYLVAGEYVNFTITTIDNNSDNEEKYKAINVSGVNGGTLMCEVRRMNRDDSTNEYNSRKRPEVSTRDGNNKKEWITPQRRSSQKQ